MLLLFRRLAILALSATLLLGDSKKSEQDQKIELMRGLTAEYAKVVAPLPRSKKPLDFESTGAWDKEKWDAAGKDMGPAARVGDLVQVTRVDFEKDSIILEINNGNRSRGKWYDHLQVGVGSVNTPVGRNQSDAPGGTVIAVRFHGPLGEINAAEVKKLLAPVLDFEKHSATEQYVETLPPEIKQAIQDKKPVEGMDRDQVLLALGRPNRKTRESKDGTDFEDWIYGEPPGRVTFVTFQGQKVVRIKDTYAGLGGTIAESPKTP